MRTIQRVYFLAPRVRLVRFFHRVDRCACSVAGDEAIAAGNLGAGGRVHARGPDTEGQALARRAGSNATRRTAHAAVRAESGIVDVALKVNAMHAVRELGDYLIRHRDTDEEATNILGSGLDLTAHDPKLKAGKIWQTAFKEWDRRTTAGEFPARLSPLRHAKWLTQEQFDDMSDRANALMRRSRRRKSWPIAGSGRARSGWNRIRQNTPINTLSTAIGDDYNLSDSQRTIGRLRGHDNSSGGVAAVRSLSLGLGNRAGHRGGEPGDGISPRRAAKAPGGLAGGEWLSARDREVESEYPEAELAEDVSADRGGVARPPAAPAARSQAPPPLRRRRRKPRWRGGRMCSAIPAHPFSPAARAFPPHRGGDATGGAIKSLRLVISRATLSTSSALAASISRCDRSAPPARSSAFRCRCGR